MHIYIYIPTAVYFLPAYITELINHYQCNLFYTDYFVVGKAMGLIACIRTVNIVQPMQKRYTSNA